MVYFFALLIRLRFTMGKIWAQFTVFEMRKKIYYYGRASICGES